MSKITQVYNKGVDIETICKLFRVSVHDVINAVYADKVGKGML